MNVKKLKKNKKGFTLVEIIVVLVIIGLLMALAVPAVTKYINEAATTKETSQVRAAYLAAQTYTTDAVAKNPSSKDDTLAAAITKTAINGVLGLNDGDEGSVESITCTVSDQQVTSCTISLTESDKEYTADRNNIVGKDK